MEINEVQPKAYTSSSLPDTIQEIKRILGISSSDIPVGVYIAFNVFIFFKKLKLQRSLLNTLLDMDSRVIFPPKIGQDPA